jgi:hypothetical protein
MKTDKYRAALEQDFERQKFNEGQKFALFERFDKLAAVKGSEFSFKIIYDAYGSRDDTEAKIQTIKGLIEKEITAYSKSHPGISTNPLVRLREYIKRHNALVDKASVSINGIDVTPEELAAGKIKVPSFAKEVVTYTATASKNNKDKGFSMVVMY